MFSHHQILAEDGAVVPDDNSYYIPPYTDDDPTIDTDEQDIDGSQGDAFKISPMPKKCYGLALSDSHNLGPYQAGVIQELTKEHKKTGQAQYQVVSGIALGAINAHIYSQFPLGKEEDASRKLEDFWTKLAEYNEANQLVQSWSWGMLYGFFYENSLYDASKLYDFIENYFAGAEINRNINIGLANVLNGQFKSFKGHHGSDEFIKVL